jgi:phage tail-like protein
MNQIPILAPTAVYNFYVLLWEVQGPGLFGLVAKTPATRFAIGAASAAVSAVGQAFLGAYSDATGLNANMEVEIYNEGGYNHAAHKFPTRGKFDNVVLKRGVSPRTSLWDWHEQVVHGSAPILRKSGLIILFDRAGIPEAAGRAGPGQVQHFTSDVHGFNRMPIGAWYIDNAFPEKITGPTLDAKSNTIAVESIELAHEGLQRVSLAMIPGAADAVVSMGGLLGGG